MKKIACIIFLISFIVSAQTSEEILVKSYEQNSKKQLDSFFKNWNEKYPTIQERDLLALNDTLQNSYNVFKEFYQPQYIKKLGGSEWGNNLYIKSKYLIVQDKIRIYFTEKVYYSEKEIDEYVVNYINKIIKDDVKRQSLLKRTNGKLSESVLEIYSPYDSFYKEENEILTDSITDFRPSINCNGKKPVYLTSEYDNILNIFLGNTQITFGEENIIKPASSSGESEKRKQFLEKLIKICYGHWGGYWQLHSYPTASRIVFDRKMHYAKVYFRMVYQGGEAILKNENGKWSLISSRLTWIE
jgi:hypothetical protein